jgi:NitT/TauT family transport system permease protein
MMERRIRINLTRSAILIVLILLWVAVSQSSNVAKFFVGSPAHVAVIILDWCVSGLILENLAVTLIETLLAFVIGAGLGLATGLWLALNRFWATVLDPFIKAANSMPRLILAPIFTVWFGLGMGSKIALGVTLVFFVVFFNVYQGIRDVSPVLVANVRMLGANNRQLIWRVYIPSATTWVFSSLHVSVGMAFVGVVIGEYLGSYAGIGYLIMQAEGQFDIDSVFAGIITLSIFALALDSMISVIEAKLLVWHP